jgi:hypothetical protein
MISFSIQDGTTVHGIGKACKKARRAVRQMTTDKDFSSPAGFDRDHA